ncbi:MAG: hypothetical protein WD063_08465 [Pirellulales bacterium]
MLFKCYRSPVIRNLAVMTDDPKKLPGSDLKWELFTEFDEADPTRKAWIRDELLQAAKDMIAKDGFAQMQPGASVLVY